MRNILIITLLFLASSVFGQIPTISNSVFVPNEKLSYIAKYNMKGLMTELAGIDMEVSDIKGKKKPIYRLKFTANTLTSWDDYVKVRHAYQTYVDPSTMKPLIMAQDSDVKGITTKGKYTFKHKSGTTQTAVSKNSGNTVNKTIPIKSNSFDLVSFIYLVRTIDYNNLKIGEKIPLSIVFLERLIEFNIKYLGKENLKVNGMGNKECYKIGIVLNKKFIVEPEVTYIWLTADDNRVPALISTVYKEGKALIELSKFEGLKN